MGARDSASARVSRRSQPAWRKWLPLLGLVLLGWVFSRLDLAALGAAFARVSVLTVGLSCVWFTLNLWLKVLRWQRLLLAQGIALSHRVTLAAFLSAQFYAQVTVGRVGEFVRIEALSERGIGMGTALASCVFDRLIDVFLVLSTGAVFAAFVVGNRGVAAASLVGLTLIGVCGALVLRVLGRAPSEGDRNSAVQAASAGPSLAARLVATVRELARGMLPMLRPLPLAEALLWSLVAWSAYFAALYTLADGLHLSVSRVLLTATAAFAALSALLPVTVSGLGARELIYIQVLQTHGVASELAVALSLLHLMVMSLTAVALGLLGVVWRQQQRL